LVVPS
jgi:hypothetical protein